METTLNLENQNLSTIPEDVYIRKDLTDVYIKAGNDIPVSERYKLLDILTNITSLDDLDVSKLRSGIDNLNQMFVRRLKEVFLTKTATEIFSADTDNEATRISNMVTFAQTTITAGPEALKDFKNDKLERLIKENYEVYVSEALEVKMKMPKPQKELFATPAKKSRKSLKGKKSKLNKSREKQLKLSYLLQTHSKNNDPKDMNTKVWMCEFQPDIDNPGKTTNIAATCGGDSVCFIDCDTGTIVKKYKELGEEFYCMSWTILKCRNELTGEERRVPMLAVAGLLKDIKLIEPEQLVCYQHVSNHKKPIDALTFHPVNSYWMFCGSEDGTITFWDLGNIFSSDTRTASKKMTLKAGPCGTVRQIAILPHGKIVLGACDDGLYAWNISTILQETRNPTYKISFASKKTQPLDSANCLSNNIIAVKRVEEGYIYIFKSESGFLEDDSHILHQLTWRETETPFLKFNFCPGSFTLLAGDDEGVIWLYDLHELFAPSPKRKNDDSSSDFPVLKLKCDCIYAKLFNHVSASSSLDHVVGVSDANVVAIWKKS